MPPRAAPLDWAQALHPEAIHPDRRNRLPVRRHGLPRVQRTDVRRLHAPAARRRRPRVDRRGAVRAKLIYLATTPDIRGIHEKAILEATLFGLPMFGVKMPGPGHYLRPGIHHRRTNGFDGDPGAALGLEWADVPITSPLDAAQRGSRRTLRGGTATATYYSGPNGVVTNPAEPAIPLVARNVTVPGRVLRGVGFRGGSYIDQTVIPLTGAPADPTSRFAASIAVRVPGVLPDAPGDAELLRRAQRRTDEPARHPGATRRTGAADGSATLRRYPSLDLRLYYTAYTGAAALSDAPTMTTSRRTSSAATYLQCPGRRRSEGGHPGGLDDLHGRPEHLDLGRPHPGPGRLAALVEDDAPADASAGRTSSSWSRPSTASASSRSTTTSAGRTRSARPTRRSRSPRQLPRRSAIPTSR